MTITLEKANHDRIEVQTNASGDIIVDGLVGLDKLVADTNSTYDLSYGSYKRGTITLPNGIVKHWVFAAR